MTIVIGVFALFFLLAVLPDVLGIVLWIIGAPIIAVLWIIGYTMKLWKALASRLGAQSGRYTLQE